jgi:hypothetical protein
MTQAWRRISWAIPPLFCLAFYWYGLKCWFRQDDFAWLQLTAQVHNWRDFLHTMFTPLAQGTIRPWSERAYFMGLYTIFGLDALPFRICLFLTQIANLTLIRAVTARVTGSAMAGFWAGILWISNSALMVIMTWSSAYNQALCGFFLLLAFYFLLRYIETGEARFNRAQWIVFLLGFGALELNVVYPALAAAYTFLCARRYFRRTLPMFIPSVVFTAVHRAVAPAVAAPSYVMRFDSTIVANFWNYLLWARGVDHDPWLHRLPEWVWPVNTALILAALAAFAIVQARNGRKASLFLAAWFVILLAPVLPLSYHRTEYYVALPAIGLAMLGGWAIVSAWQSRSRQVALGKAATAALVVIYLSPLPALHAETKLRYEFSRRIEGMVRGVVRAHQLHPDRIILLSDVSDELFWNGLLDYPFRLLGIPDVYVSPETEAKVIPHPELGAIGDYVLPAAATLDGLSKDRIVVYSAAGDRLKNVTGVYEALAHMQLRAETPRRVDVANDLLAYLLGGGWYQNDGTHRWMPKRAIVRLGGPRSASGRLYLTGYCPAQQWEKGALPLTVAVDGALLSTVDIKPGTGRFDFDFALPPGMVGKESVEVAVEIGRTFAVPGDDRQLGVAFGVFEIR